MPPIIPPFIGKPPAGVLFDLDGTLVDTAPDLLAALNLALQDHDLSVVTMKEARPAAAHGSMALVRAARPNCSDTEALSLQRALLAHYEIINGQQCRLFEGMQELLDCLSAKNIPWGIVTNKAARFARPLIQKLDLSHCQSLISGDSLTKGKPDPAPLCLAASQLNCIASEVFYLGDAKRDMESAKAAGMTSVLALWGYLDVDHALREWPVDIPLGSPLSLIDYLN